MRHILLTAFVLVVILIVKPPKAYCERIEAELGGLPGESYLKLSPTLPNSELDFSNDSQNSCCAHDYGPHGEALPSAPAPALFSTSSPIDNFLVTEFDRANPQHSDVTIPTVPVSCQAFESLPIWVSNGHLPVTPLANLPITAYSTNISRRPGAVFSTDSTKHKTSDFHIEASGGDSKIALQDVQHYSVCMARGQNELLLGNTSDASVMTYGGNDHITLAGNSTDMFTRTGAGEDTIEILQAQVAPDGNWHANTLYKTAISGGSGIDTLFINETPPGTKWCYVGLYRLYGELFHVVEFALPPTVTSGPRRQRVNIGESIERVRMKGRSYALSDFLNHGEAQSSIAVGRIQNNLN
jgi:hypothetical protein